MLSGIGAPELIIIAIVIMVLFGAKKLPDASRSLGRSLRIFKAETKGLREDNVEAKNEAPHVRHPLPSSDSGAAAATAPHVYDSSAREREQR